MAPSISFSEDLISEFLLRLPVKPLLRLRTVSKSWLSLISSPNFIGAHLRRAITSQQTDETLVLTIDWVSVSLISLNSCLIGATPEVCHPTLDLSIRRPKVLVVGSCNGIVCASVTHRNGENVYHKICLWNPATKQYKRIPPHNIHKNASLGFGFDPIGDDFKVLRLIYDNKIHNKIICAEVYSVNRNSWRLVEPNPTDCPMDITLDCCVRGVLCSTGMCGLITFDLHTEVFNCGIKYPPTCRYPHYVTEYNDLIALISSSSNNGSSKIKLWTLNDACLHGGMEEPWTLIFSFDLGGSVDWICGCFNRGDIILRVNDSDKDDYWVDDIHFLCNPENGESKIVHFPEEYAGRFFRHIESLVSIKGSKQVMCDSNADDNLGRQLFWYSDYDE